MALKPEQSAALRDAFGQIAEPITDWLLKDAAERIALAGKMTSTASYELYRAKALGESQRELKKFLKRQLKLSNKEIRRLFRQAARFSRDNDEERVGLTSGADMEQMTAAAVKLAQRDFHNLTQTLGMVTPGGAVQPLQRFYQETMDFAFEQIFTGAADYQTAIRQATTKMADAGVRTIDYESGISIDIEAAVRRNMMGGMGLLDEQITRTNHDVLGCNGWEISAHANSAPDHEPYQGLQYSDKDFEELNGTEKKKGKLQRRIGTLSCGHFAMPIILGVNSPQYTEQQLQAFREENAKGITYEGRHYTGYEATQKQRQLERAQRKQKRRILVAETTGDTLKEQAAQIKLQMLRQHYKAFSKAAGLPLQEERAWVARLEMIDDEQKAKIHSLDFMGKPRIFSDRNKIISVKGYAVKGHDGIFAQTYSLNAQNTVDLIEKEKEKIPQLKKVKEILIAKDIPGIAAYDYVDNRLYVSEMISNVEYTQKIFSGEYFVAENAEDTLRHEMHHKDHQDLIDRKALTSGKDRDTVKKEIEADLRSYVMRQSSSQHDYVSAIVSVNAANGLKLYNSLNELIAEVLLQNDKGIVRDKFLMEKVGDMFYDDSDVK